MQLPIILFGLMATASAIDISFYFGEGCSGNGVVCRNASPNMCCGGAGINYTSIGFSGIPSDWRTRCKVWGPGGCSQFPIRTVTPSSDFVCIEGGGYYSASYDLALVARSDTADGANIAERQDWSQVDWDLGDVDWNDVDYDP